MQDSFRSNSATGSIAGFRGCGLLDRQYRLVMLLLRPRVEHAMDRSRAALVAVIAAQWLAIIGGTLIMWWLLDGHHWHLAAGGISLALAAVVGVSALSLADMPAKPAWGMRLRRE
jgi:hypothetical protein